MNLTLRRLHRYLAFTVGLLWLSQALTGLLMVYRWEIDDATIAGPATRLDVDALGARIDALDAATTGSTVTQLYVTGGVDGRYDLYVDDAAGDTTLVRVDGSGQVLRTRASRDGLIPKAASLHQTLLAGDTGHWIVGVSGVLLLLTIGMGFVIGWPQRHAHWSRVLWPRGARPGAARRYAWHRSIGLMWGVPAAVLVTAGVLMTFESPIKGWLGLDATPPELAQVAPPVGVRIATATALAAALARFPGAELSGARLPSAEQPWYRIRVRQPDEWRRVYGTTVVYVAAADGRLLLVEDAFDAPRARAFMDNLYPVHTGEALGFVGRLIALATGVWLLTMLVLGFGTWLARRGAKR